ncbi:globoside alpha-1,3-N-acetylgalactosaminyltransferase 1 isoform X2 [Elgaria multicarinata webbii]|uniref:globoside alpha-1,3-N-acetylgalactosaminyltransferase 1 isoform X2 n=1 Tax=Elgaria multicarinata webbii TaxID=159646 RepID=UPI002FCD4283
MVRHLLESRTGNMKLMNPVFLGLFILASFVFIWALIWKGPTVYLPYYLPCPDVFAMKLQYREEKTPELFPQLFYPQPNAMKQTRSDVLTVTPWLAPIVWEGTFDSEILDNVYKPLNLTIGVTVFAVGKYTQFAGHFLESAERYFMTGYRVNYYIFTDNPQAIPAVHLQPGRTLSLVLMRKRTHWQEISMRRMEAINRHISETAHREVDYLFCLDVDLLFHNPWGPETLGEMVAVLHPGYYKAPRTKFPYERRRESAAYISSDEGDFYYAGGAFGGLVKRVYVFTWACHMTILADKANEIMAVWQEESHLNRHFLSHKPSKVLSPEYLWDGSKTSPPEVRLIKMSAIVKNHRQIRE